MTGVNICRVYCAVFGFFFFRAYRQTLFFLSFSFSICFSAFSLSVFRSELFSFLPETSYLLLLRIAYVRSITAPAMIIIPPIVKTAVPMPPVIGRLKLLLPFVRTKFNCHVFVYQQMPSLLSHSFLLLLTHPAYRLQRLFRQRDRRLRISRQSIT